MRVAALVPFVAVLALAAAPERAPSDAPLQVAMREYLDAERKITSELGAALATHIHGRLANDVVYTTSAAPPGYDPDDWRETVSSIVTLDTEAIRQLAAGTRAPLDAAPGLHERFVLSAHDGTWQPVAVYTPPSLGAAARAPLVVVLHGSSQTESELLGPPFLRRLADKTGSIVVAPYGRGAFNFAEPAASEVYDLVAQAQRALPVDARRTYLVGYSMGGFALFHIGPRGGYRWKGAMCIAGAMTNNVSRSVLQAWQDLPLYIVNGAYDENVPPRDGAHTAAWLAARGVPVSFYQQSDGTHAMRTLMPALERAWIDMHDGIVHPESVPPERTTT